VDHARCTPILAKSGIADLEKLNVPLARHLLFLSKLQFYVQFQGQIDTSALQNVTNSFKQQNRDRLNNKTAIFAQWGDDCYGHSGLSQQPTMKLTILINTTSTDPVLASALAMSFFNPRSAILTQSYGKSIGKLWYIFA
jgi:hypothetical protein